MLSINSQWILCPVCGNKTRNRIREDTILKNYPLYGATRDGKVIIFTGSKITGGFCITTYSLLSNSKLKHILEDCPVLRDCLLSEGEFIQYKGRKYAWLDIDKNGVIKLPHSTLAVLDLQSGMELLAIRSSDIAFTMGAKGPLLQKAHM